MIKKSLFALPFMMSALAIGTLAASTGSASAAPAPFQGFALGGVVGGLPVVGQLVAPAEEEAVAEQSAAQEEPAAEEEG